MSVQSHENLTSFRDVAIGSNRKFGMTVGAILMGLALWPLVRHHGPVRLWLFACGLVLLACGLALPDLLGPLNRLWFRFGLVLAKITNPIVMGVMFFLVVVPFGWFLRARGRDLLRLRREPDAASYWIERDLAVPTSLSKQF